MRLVSIEMAVAVALSAVATVAVAVAVATVVVVPAAVAVAGAVPVAAAVVVAAGWLVRSSHVFSGGGAPPLPIHVLFSLVPLVSLVSNMGEEEVRLAWGGTGRGRNCCGCCGWCGWCGTGD